MSFLGSIAYNIIGDVMVIRIKKIQFLCGICLLMQILCAMWLIPFHLFAVALSCVIIGWQRKFRVLQVQYHFYCIGLYIYRLWLLSVSCWGIFETIYLCIALYVAIMILLCSCKAIL